MERVINVKFDSDYWPQRRRVRSAWSAWSPGTVIEVEMNADGGIPKWVSARIERNGGTCLWVVWVNGPR